MVIALALENNKFDVKVSGFCISNLRFADDICLVAKGNDDLQQTVDKVYTIGNRFGLEVNRTKTEVQCIGREKEQMKTSLGTCTELTQCEEFVYLGGITDTSFDLLWTCDSHRKGQISKYLDAWVHTWTMT